ncbi:MAG: PD40 domain-containing protein [Pleurocapsa minor GSE-CHR-MK-17-07R]|jgi:hypothetical protein|nr:PD40 domain-containing protein [Pleurocapsa minor GSE-CHR-MK 17-07R]
MLKNRTPHLLAGMFVAGIALAGAVAASAQEDTLRFTGVENNALVIYEGSTPTELVAGVEGVSITQTAASPDGRYIAYVAYEDATGESTLVAYDTTTGLPTTIAQNPAPAYPVSFTIDSASIVYAMQGASIGQNDDGSAFNALDVYVQPLDGGEAEVTSLRTNIGCGGGLQLPTETLYTRETLGLGGNSLMLAATPFGIVYSPNCNGVGVTLYSPENGGSEETFMDVARVALSPDRTRLAAIPTLLNPASSPELLVIDLETREISRILINAMPDRVAWSADGSALYFSVQAYDTTVVLEGERAERLSAVLGEPSFNRFTTILHRIDLETGVDSEVFVQSAFAISRIQPVENGVIVTTIDNVDFWAMAIADGEYDYVADETGEAGLALIPVTTWFVPETLGDPTEAIARDVMQVTVLP